MEPQPSTSRGFYGGGGGGGGGGSGGINSMAQSAIQQYIMSPIPGPSNRPYLAQPVHIPQRFLVPPEKLLPHQIKSGIDIVNLFKILNSLQNRIALACGQHQYLRDPLNQPRPPEDGGYKPLTPQAAVRDLRSLCKQQRNLMEKLRRWNCTNDGKCFDMVMSGTYTGICTNCEPFAASRMRMKRVGRTLRKQKAKAKRKALKSLITTEQSQQGPNKNTAIKAATTVRPAPTLPPPQPPPPTPVRKQRKRMCVCPEPPHPETFLSQESFLSELGLVTPEVYLKVQADSRRTERRRRTTANPKYKSSSFVTPTELGRTTRSTRSDPSKLQVPPTSTISSPTGAERRKAKQKRYECTVCGRKDVSVQCGRCASGFHPDCIRVTASRAPSPDIVTVCPNCVHCNPSIRPSDCILLSRRLLRPSIYGVDGDDEPKPRGKPRNSNKSGSRRRTTSRRYSKSSRRAAASKSKKMSITPEPACTPKKPTQSTKKSYAKRTLNHSSAVAAAAAVPAYCTTTLSSVETTTTQEKTNSYQTQRRRKLDDAFTTTTDVETRLHKSRQTFKSLASDRRGQQTKQETSSMQTAYGKGKEVATVTSACLVKPIPLVPTAGRITCYSKKQSPKPIDIYDDDEFSFTPCISPHASTSENSHPGGSRISAFAFHQKVDASSRPKKMKPEKTEENIYPVETEIQTQSKGTNGKTKKGNGSKQPPIDPFCMKRTMMAMSAAAGIVLSNNTMKISRPHPPPSPDICEMSAIYCNSKAPEPAPKPVVTSTATSSTQEVEKSIATEAKVKPIQKPLTNPGMFASRSNLNSKSTEKAGNNAVTASSSTSTGRVMQKTPKAAIIKHLPVEAPSTISRSDYPIIKVSDAVKPFSTAVTNKAIQKPQKPGTSISATVVSSFMREAKLSNFKCAEPKGKNVQKIPTPAIISQLAALKNKSSEKVMNSGKTAVAPMITTGAPSMVKSPVKTTSMFDMAVRKMALSSTEAAMKTVPLASKPATIVNPVTFKKKLPEEKPETVVTERKVKSPRKTPTKANATANTLQKYEPQDTKVCKKSPTPRARKPPKPVVKMTPALEQSYLTTIERVIKEGVAAVERDQLEYDLSLSITKNCEHLNLNKSKPSHKYQPKKSSGKAIPNTSIVDAWEISSNVSDEYQFECIKFPLNTNKTSIPVNKEVEKPSSPVSNSSTIGSPRLLCDLESDSEEDLLSIPDTRRTPYLELKRLELPGPYLDLSPLVRYEKYRKGLSFPRAIYQGRGRGRGGRR